MAAYPGGWPSCPADAKLRARAASTSGAAASSRVRVHSTKSTSKAAPDPGSVAAGRVAGLPAPPQLHLDPTMEITFFEQGVHQLPLVEVIVTCSGFREQHDMTARHCPRLCRFYRREPLARDPSIGARPKAAPATFQEFPRGTSGVPGRGWHALPGGRPAGTPRRWRPPTGRRLPLAGTQRRWRRCASSRCRRLPPPASQRSGGTRPAWPRAL